MQFKVDEALKILPFRLWRKWKKAFLRTNKPPRQWLKSHEVQKMLKISTGTLQNLRINGTLRFARMGRIIFYDAEDIEKVLEENVQ